VARVRDAAARTNEAKAWCDEIVTDACMASMLAEVDEVHTPASLSGQRCSEKSA
jgi:capsule polysaccharide export protein KpsC/LpsZ